VERIHWFIQGHEEEVLKKHSGPAPQPQPPRYKGSNACIFVPPVRPRLLLAAQEPEPSEILPATLETLPATLETLPATLETLPAVPEPLPSYLAIQQPTIRQPIGTMRFCPLASMGRIKKVIIKPTAPAPTQMPPAPAPTRVLLATQEPEPSEILPATLETVLETLPVVPKPLHPVPSPPAIRQPIGTMRFCPLASMGKIKLTIRKPTAPTQVLPAPISTATAPTQVLPAPMSTATTPTRVLLAPAPAPCKVSMTWKQWLPFSFFGTKGKSFHL
jgi:hypothetical protein